MHAHDPGAARSQTNGKIGSAARNFQRLADSRSPGENAMSRVREVLSEAAFAVDNRRGRQLVAVRRIATRQVSEHLPEGFVSIFKRQLTVWRPDSPIVGAQVGQE